MAEIWTYHLLKDERNHYDYLKFLLMGYNYFKTKTFKIIFTVLLFYLFETGRLRLLVAERGFWYAGGIVSFTDLDLW